MLVSVVTIALNAARDLPLTIESVAGQDFDNFEYVVVDGQSWDSSFEILKRYEKCIDRVLEVEDAGVYSAMNFAVSQCRGKYVLFMNAGDTFYSSKALSNIFSFLGDEEPDIIHGDHVYVDRHLELHKRSIDFSVTREALLKGELSHQWHDRFPCHQATLTKRELLERLGGYDLRFEICADHDFLLRAFDAGANVKYVDETIAHYFGGGMSAQRGDRCTLEWVHAYRARSRYPQKVDRFFGAEHLVHYDTQSQTTGAKLSGFYPIEGPSPSAGIDSWYCWCAGDGFSIVSPQAFDSIALVLEGENPLEHQRFTVISEGQTLCEVDVPRGEMEIVVPFPSPLPPRSIVEIHPARATSFHGDGRYVSIRLKHFHFQSADALELKPLTLGRELAFAFRTAERAEPLLRGGWSKLEATHVWSTGSASHLALPVDGSARELSITLSGNPWVAEGDRSVTISINGETLCEDVPLSIAPAQVNIPLVGTSWRSHGSNFVTLVPKQTGRAPNDSRNLGVCLYSATLIE